MMTKPNSTHLAEETLEMYSMGRLSETETEHVEEHLLICSVCQDRLTETDQFVQAIRSAARELEKEPVRVPWWSSLAQKLFLIPKPAWAAAACAALALVVFIPRQTPTSVVDMQAMRGPEAPVQAPANADLTLRLSLKGLDNPGPLQVQVADATGKIVAISQAQRQEDVAIAHANKLSAGTYWVRLYSGTEILREYGLTVH
jgi:anti-sigma factor RsiW